MAHEAVDVGLFVTCLVDLFRPSVGFAAVKLLEDADCRVHVPDVQTCCGQPARAAGPLPHALCFVTGPSCTGDIGLRIEVGAHGPRRLHIVIVDGEGQGA